VLADSGSDDVSVLTCLTVVSAATTEATANAIARMSMRCASTMRRPLLRRTTAKSPHPANPAHEPELSKPLPCANIGGKPVGLPRALRASGSSLRFRGRDQIVSSFQDSSRRRDLNDTSIDFHLSESRLKQSSKRRPREPYRPARIFPVMGWNQKLIVWLVPPGSGRRVPISGYEFLFDLIAGRVERREAAHRGGAL